MIFIFTITIIGPIETGKPNPKKKHLHGFLNFILMSFFHSNYKKEKNIYNNNHKEESLGGETQEYYDWQTITTQHKYLLMVRNERYKNENK